MSTEKQPWKTLDSFEVYDNPWISVREDQVVDPSGGDGLYGVISFKNIAVGIIPIDQNANVYLVGQSRYALGEYSWEIPMGGVLRDDDVLEGAKKELKEETGLAATRWTQIMRLHPSNSVTDEEGLIFIAQDLTEGEQNLEDTEDIKLIKIPLAEAVQWARSNKNDFALVTSNGGVLSKHASAVYSQQPSFVNWGNTTCQLSANDSDKRPIISNPSAGRVVSYTVNFTHQNGPQAIILGETDSGERFASCTAPDDSHTAEQLLVTGNDKRSVTITAAEGETLHFKLDN